MPKQKRFTKTTKGRIGRKRLTGPERPFEAIPDLDCSINLRKKIRYLSNSTTGVTFTQQNLADLLVVNVTGVVAQTYRACIAIKLLKISIYGAARTGTTVNRSIEYISNSPLAPFGGPSKIISTTAVFPQTCAVHARPPIESYAAQWVNCQAPSTTPGTNLFTVTTMSGDIVDLTVELVLNTTSTQVAPSFVPSGFVGVNAPFYVWAISSSTPLIPQYFSSYF
jgi:hypothetical protein